jgi:hypothetical protein
MLARRFLGRSRAGSDSCSEQMDETTHAPRDIPSHCVYSRDRSPHLKNFIDRVMGCEGLNVRGAGVATHYWLDWGGVGLVSPSSSNRKARSWWM